MPGKKIPDGTATKTRKLENFQRPKIAKNGEQTQRKRPCAQNVAKNIGKTTLEGRKWRKTWGKAPATSGDERERAGTRVRHATGGI